MADITKRWIAEKMKELMKVKSIDKIRVTEICRLSGIERPTFYYHFKDKYDLVAWIFFKSADDTDVVSAESAANAMKKMKQDFLFYKRAYEDASQNALWTYMLEYFVLRYEKIVKDKLNTDVISTQMKFSIRHYCYGSVGMTKEWLLYDNTTSAEVVVEMMFNSMPSSLYSVLIEK